MLMFDNAIFASFIPQILMLLGYFACLLAPVHHRLEKYEVEPAQIITYTQPTVDSTHAIAHFQNYINQTGDICETQSLSAPPADSSVIIFPCLLLETNQGLLSKLFSRPPPAIC